MSVESRHLDLADMVAEVSSGPADEQVRGHLAICAGCRAESGSWAAVASGVRYLAADVTVPTGAAWESALTGTCGQRRRLGRLGPDRPVRSRRPLRPGRRELIAAATAAAAVAALLVVLLPGHSRLARPLTTSWQAARALPADAVTGASASAGGWRLASYLVSAGWRQDTVGPEPGYLTCPADGTCYVQGDSATSASGPADMNSFYVSTTGGLTWSVLPVPSGLTFSSALSCSSAAHCAAGGLYNGQSVLAQTTDGGHSWTVEPLLAPVHGVIFQLSCPTTSTCAGLLTTSPVPLPNSQQYYGGVTFVRTTDGGRRFSTSAFRAGAAMQALSCPTARDCVVVGVSASLGAADVASGGYVLTTADGGVTWTPGRLPSGFTPGPTIQVTCPDTGHCFMLGTPAQASEPGQHASRQPIRDSRLALSRLNLSFQLGAERAALLRLRRRVRAAPHLTTIGPSNQSASVAVSADGGRTWTQRSLPADVPQPSLSAISCPTDSTCYVSGTEAIGQRFPAGGFNGGSAMILVTADSGQSWDRVMFPVPARVPPGMQIDAFMDIGSIQCPQVGTCVALAVADQGSRSTPVYIDGTAP